MSNSIKNMLGKKLLWILLLFTIPTFYLLVRPGFYTMHDDLQAFRVHQMDKCIKDFQIPCRWVPDMGYQYGYPQFNYYPPSIYYLAEGFHLLGFQFIDTIKILVSLGMILSALFMYLFLAGWLGEWPAFVGSVLYTYAPYKAVDAYVRGALSEFYSLIIFPLIFWSILRLVKYNNLKSLAFFAFSVGLLLITHNLMSLIFLPLIAVFAITLIILDKKWVVLKKLVIGGLLGFGLAAFFILPVVWEKDFAHIESIIGGYFDYRQHFVNLNQLFISNYFGYGSSVWGDNDEMSLSTGQVHWILGTLSLILAWLVFKKEKKKAIITVVLATLTLITLFMTHQKSSVIWESLGFLTWMQFPWRFLADSIFLLSILASMAVYFVSKRLSLILGISAIGASLILYASFFHPRQWLNISDNDKFSGSSWEKQLTVSIFDYLPIYAKLPPTAKAADLPEVLEGDVDFIIYKKGSNYQNGRVEVLTEKALLRMPFFDFPGMKVTVDGRKVDHWHDDCRREQFCLGLITFPVPSGMHNIEAKLYNTPIRTIGNFFTVVSLMVVAWLFFYGSKNEKIS